MDSAKGDKCEKILNVKYQQDEECFDIQMKKIVTQKSEELHILVENDENDMWDFSCSHQYLIELDSIFKKFPDIIDVMELISENVEANNLRLETSGYNLLFFFKAKFIKAESNVKLNFRKRSKDDENPLVSEMRVLRKEIEQLKYKKKVPVISYVGTLQNNDQVNGELVIRTNQTVIFHLFVDYKVAHGTNNEETLTMQIKNDYHKDEIQEKVIYKTWIGMYNAATYQESRNTRFMFGEKLNKGTNKIILKKKGNGTTTISSLYLVAEP